MSDEQQTPASQTNGASADAHADDGARKEPTLDDLLKEWDKPAEEPKGRVEAKQKDTSSKEVSSLKEEIDGLKQHLADQSYKEDMSKVVSTVKGDLGAQNKFVEFWVNERATEDERLQTLWNERDKRPQEFNKAIEALGRDFQTYWNENFASKHDDTRRQVAAAAMASGSTPAPPEFDRVADEMASMNDRDFTLKKHEIFRHFKSGGGKQ